MTPAQADARSPGSTPQQEEVAMGKSLVTGGAGFLGSAIVRELVAAGTPVRVLARNGEPLDNLEGIDAEVVFGDVLSPSDCRNAVAGCEVVYHAAAIYESWAPNPTRMYEVNIRGTFNMLEAARRAGVSRVVYTASIVALGRPAVGTIGDETTAYEAWDLDFPYCRTKYLSLMTARDFAAWGLDVRMVCPGIVLGPGDIRPTPSGKLIINTVKGYAPGYIDGGASYVDVRDVAHVHVLAAERGKAGEVYLGTVHNLDNRALIAAIAKVAGVKVRNFRIPTMLAIASVKQMERLALKTGKEPLITLPFMTYSLRPAFYNNAKSVTELGATYRPLEETIADAIEYFRRTGKLRAAKGA